jgi:hypothetical protein
MIATDAAGNKDSCTFTVGSGKAAMGMLASRSVPIGCYDSCSITVGSGKTEIKMVATDNACNIDSCTLTVGAGKATLALSDSAGNHSELTSKSLSFMNENDTLCLIDSAGNARFAGDVTFGWHGKDTLTYSNGILTLSDSAGNHSELTSKSLLIISPVPSVDTTGIVSAGYRFPDGTVQTTAAADCGWTDDGTVVRLSDGTDKVGIGTTTPQDQLEITGNLRLPYSTASVGVIKSGGAPFIHNFGTANVFIGVMAGNLTMTGAGGNTGSGAYALGSNTTGSSNTASGTFALFNNATGNSNTASGNSALYHNTTGTSNTAGGHYALTSNTTGSDNTASGEKALYNNTTGHDNTASGTNALYNNTTANYNTATGAYALGSNTTGHHNTASGSSALSSNTTGNNNTAAGNNALINNTTGIGNTACGYYALYSDTTGNNNTAIGYQADVSTGALTNATAIGANASVDASNKIRLGDAAVTVIEGQVAYTFTSDKNQKENFKPVDGDEVLRKIRELGVTSWNYKGQDPNQFRHYGPVAQEFFAAFGHDGVGTSGTPTTINSGDMAGILMIAVQALEKRTDEVEALKSQVAELREMIRAQAGEQK